MLDTPLDCQDIRPPRMMRSEVLTFATIHHPPVRTLRTCALELSQMQDVTYTVPGASSVDWVATPSQLAGAALSPDPSLGEVFFVLSIEDCPRTPIVEYGWRID